MTVITPTRVKAAAAHMPGSKAVGPMEALVFPVAAQRHLVTQSRSTDASIPHRSVDSPEESSRM